MEYTKSELEVFKNIGNGENSIKQLSVNKSKKQLYKIINSLFKKNMLEKNNNLFELKKISHIKLLFSVLTENPNLIPILADSGIKILSCLIEEKSILEMEKEVFLKKSIIYRKLKQMINLSLITKTTNYKLNKKIWPNLIEYLIEAKKYEMLIDDNIPFDSTIYFKTERELLYSTKSDLLDTKTAFSKYEDFGIKLFLTKNYYFLPAKKLSEKNILKHTLIICKKEKTIQNLIFLSLFYLKFKEKFKSVKDEILFDIDKVLLGEKLAGYPTYEEIFERARLYNIKV